MKTLYLVRHGKASWEMPGTSDFDRTLLPKGEKKTELVAEFLKKRNSVIDLILSSPAARAYETALIMARVLDYPSGKIKTDRKIYDGYYDRILDLIYGTDNSVNSLMIFGHNPTITQMANLFLTPGLEAMPTSCVVCMSFNTDKWEAIPSVEATVEFVITPKMLK